MQIVKNDQGILVIGLKPLLLPFSATSFAIQKVSADPQHKVMIEIFIIQDTKENKKGGTEV